MEKYYFYLYRTENCTKRLLEIIEIDFIENLYWKSITCNFIELEIVRKEFLELLKENLLRIYIGKLLLVQIENLK